MKKIIKFFTIIIIVCFFAAFPSESFADLRPLFEDEQIVERSELIVIGHLIRDSVEYIPHDTRPGEGRSWEHHAVLTISQVLKGSSKDKKIPITIHYGLTPVVGGFWENNGGMMNLKGNNDSYPDDIIEIMDSGSSALSFEPLVQDAGENNIWFLRRLSGIYGREAGSGDFSIVDPEDLQHLELKQYFLAYLSDDPESIIKESFSDNDLIFERIQRYLDHKEIQRILLIPNKSKRVEALFPFFLKRAQWGNTNETKQGIIDCGVEAGIYLREIFKNPQYKALGYEIIKMMGEIGDKKNIPVLISLLEKHHKFWATQELEKGWWNNNIRSELTAKRRKIYGEVYMSVYALNKLDAVDAFHIIKKAKKQWESIDFDNPQIVEECNKFLGRKK